ncbi:MAG: hypothetical protein H6861_00715 [Rhodospirillales bacterium]|nr:hypothetical protein [Rhodospirillales bacterium]
MKQISGYFLILFMVISFAMALPALFQGYRETGKIALEVAVNGNWASQYEKEFADSVAVREPGLTLWGMVELLLFRDGRPGVLIGKDGWLFSDEEFSYSKNREDLIRQHKDFIAETIARLHKDGVGLAVALLPAKSRTAQDKLGRFTYPSYNQGLYADVLSMIQERDVIAPDLSSALRGRPEAFLRTDTHWSPQGAQTVANALASAIKANDAIQLEAQPFILEEDTSEPLKGDLLRYVPAGLVLEHFGLSTVEVPQHNAIANSSEQIEQSALFGDVNIPVTLVGTSYSANEMWNFADYLKAALQSDVFNAADEGRGPFATMKDYLDSESYKNNPPALIIWEIPERYIALPDKD